MATTTDFRFGLGDKLKDKVTGIEGICVTRANHISGCDTYGLQPLGMKDGVPHAQVWLDEPRLELVQAKALALPDTREIKTGADSVPQSTRQVPR